MNSPNPIIPQGSTPEQKQHGRKRFFIAFFTIVSLNAAFLVMALFIQGCKRQPTAEQPPVDPYAAVNVDTNYFAPADSNQVAGASAIDTNAAVQVEQPLPQVSPVPPSVTEHTIVKGDMLGDIAKKYGVTLAALKAANPAVDEKRLQIGKKIVIPPPVAAPDAGLAQPNAVATIVAESGEQIHDVKSGENLTVIANRYGTTVRAIQNLNGKKDTRILVGDKLKIPARSATETAPTAPR